MGKTATGEKIWLDAERTSPYAYYQYWLNRTDEEAPRLLRMFSLRAVGEIDEVLREHDRARERRVAQRELARAMTAWVHGEAAARDAEAAGEAIFDPARALESREALERLASAVPTFDLSRTELDAGVPVVDLFARAFGESKSRTRTLVTGNGAYVNDVRVRAEDVHRKITTADLAHGAFVLLRSGKRDYRLVRVK